MTTRCTSCGWQGQHGALGLREGPKCKGSCGWVDLVHDNPHQDRNEWPPVFEFGDIVKTPKGEGVVFDQSTRGGIVGVGIQGKLVAFSECDLELVTPHE